MRSSSYLNRFGIIICSMTYIPRRLRLLQNNADRVNPNKFIIIQIKGNEVWPDLNINPNRSLIGIPTLNRTCQLHYVGCQTTYRRRRLHWYILHFDRLADALRVQQTSYRDQQLQFNCKHWSTIIIIYTVFPYLISYT